MTPITLTLTLADIDNLLACIAVTRKDAKTSEEESDTLTFLRQRILAQASQQMQAAQNPPAETPTETASEIPVKKKPVPMKRSD
jgi:hypothetical protein